MKSRMLQRDKLVQLLDRLVADYDVIAPTDEISYGPVKEAEEIHLVADKPNKSLKEFFLPTREELVRYQKSDGAVASSSVPSPEGLNRVVFGCRPCDAAALPIVDQVFAWDVADSTYFRRRRSTVVISVACEEPCASCFCVSLGGSPAGTEGSDILLTPLGDTYHVEILSDAGEALVIRYADLFADADEQQDAARAAAEALFRSRITRSVDLDGLAESLDFESPVWRLVAQQCVDCGICTYLCPTCHCFDIQDEGAPSEGARVRLWDSCAFRAYSKTAVHEPRVTHFSRYRQRIMHKFQYYPQNFGRILCVGCGRCIEHCPVSVDITQVLKAVKE